MRVHSSRPSALIAVTVVLSMAAMMASSPRFESGRDLDNLIRKTRSGPQRPDAGDALDHFFDLTDPLTATFGDGLGAIELRSIHAPPDASRVHGPPGQKSVHAPSGAVTHVVRPVLPGLAAHSTDLTSPPVSSTLLARPYRPALGRAPPTA